MSKNTQTEETCHLTALNRDQADPVALLHGKSSAGMDDAAGRRSLRVLIVDDERKAADSLSEVVGCWGHEVRWAYDGTLGLKVATAQAPEVVLLDIAMPVMDGYELAQQLRRDARLKRCLLVAMRDPNHRRRQWKPADIDLFLAKPVNLEVLETLLLLEGKRLDRLQVHN